MLERNIKKFAKLKTRSFFLLVIFILVSSIIIWLFNSPQPDLRSIVSKTHMHIKNINSKLQVLDVDDTNAKNLEIDSTYLELLGFVNEPKLFKEIDGEEKSKLAQVVGNFNLNNDALLNKISSKMPPIITAFFHFSDREKALIESKLRFFLNDLILIYDLDLSSSEQLKIKKLCNSSCVLKPFKGDKYPKHLINPKMKAYKPIIIQEVLNEYGALIWIEPPNVFISNKIDKFLNQSKTNGVLTWSLKQPVSQITHPSMFKYFDSKAEDFYFVHTLDTTQLILYNSKQIHELLMLPWVKCGLKEDCIAPPGSKYYGCDFDRRPLFHYSGCHRYEMSAFSIITSLLFNFDYNKYTMDYEVVAGGGDSGAMASSAALEKTFFANLLLFETKPASSNENQNLYEITTNN